MKSSTRYFQIKKNILADFQICISVTLSTESASLNLASSQLAIQNKEVPSAKSLTSDIGPCVNSLHINDKKIRDLIQDLMEKHL